MAEAVYLLRHAAPPPAARGRYWGRRDPGVDGESLATVADLAPLMWVRPGRVLASPLARAVATADAAAAVLGMPVETVADLAEADFGDFDGLCFHEAAELYPRQTAEWARLGDGFSFPGGEAVDGFLARARRAWEHCVNLPDTAVLAVTHGGVIAAWCCLFLRMSLRHRFAFRAGYAALTAFVRKKDGSGWELVFFNNTPS